MKKKIGLVFLMLFIWVFPQTAGAYMPFNINAFIGGKAMDDDDWGRYDDQAEFGVMADFRENTWPISLVVQVFSSIDGDSETYDTDYWDGNDAYYYYGERAFTSELNIGVKKIFNLANAWHLYIGGGAAMINGGMKVVEVEYIGDRYYRRDTDKEDDTDYGYWVSAGLYKSFWGHFNVGLEVRYSDAEIELFDSDVEAGGVHGGLVLGYSWPGY